MPRTVIVVEDDPLVRMNLMYLLEDAGFKPLAAAHADEAIEILQCRPDVQIVLTDIQMPGPTDGIKLARTIRQRWPAVELILTSGLLGGMPDCDLPSSAVFVPKPIEISRLLCALRTLPGGAGCEAIQNENG